MQVPKYKILHLSKDNLKFSSAHFLIFDGENAEKLHGHNYRVRVDFKISEDCYSEQGYGVDFAKLKSIVKSKVDIWDEALLLPEHNPHLKIKSSSNEVEVQWRHRRYVFPADEVIFLPVKNSSVEALSEVLAKVLWAEVKSLGVVGLKVEVEETVGQSCFSFCGDFSL